MGFSMLAKDVFQVKESSDVVVTGLLMGDVAVGDTVYVIRPEYDYMATVSRLDVTDDTGVHPSDTATTGGIAMHLTPRGSFNIGEYDVITDREPQYGSSGDKDDIAVTNPGLAGILEAYTFYHDDGSYMDHFVYALAHGNYLAPIRVMDGEEPVEGNYAYAALPGVDSYGKQQLPLFTDMSEVRKWQGLRETQGNVRMVLMPFPSVADLMAEGDFGAVVLNPFCERPVSVSATMIEGITQLDAYKRMLEDM